MQEAARLARNKERLTECFPTFAARVAKVIQDMEALGFRPRIQDALALDLDHADAAIAVRPVTGFRRVAQVRQLDIKPAGGAENRLAFANIDLAVVDRESLDSGFAASRFSFVAIAHRADLGLPMSQRFGQFIGEIL